MRAAGKAAGPLRPLLEPSPDLPLVGVSLTLRAGSTTDPAGKEGLTRLLGRMLRMGTRGQEPETLEHAIDAMGAHLSIACAPSYLHLGGTVLRANLPRFMELLGAILLRPALRVADLKQLRRETLDQLTNACDDDRTLVSRHFRRFAFGGHPYARPVAGTRESLARITREDLLAHHERLLTRDNLIVGVSGDLDRALVTELVERHLGGLATEPGPRVKLAAPRMSRGRRLLIVDKPGRTQTQILIGTLGTRPSDADHVALHVANTGFGGLFTSRLTHEIRSRRGWSYGASSQLGHDRQRELWSMWTFPAAGDAVACIELQLSMLEQWVEKGLTARELSGAKSYLIKSQAFEVDTAAKRLEQQVERVLYALPSDYHAAFPKKVRAVTRASAREAVASRISTRDLCVVVVATADRLQGALSNLPGIRSVQVVPFDEV